jgi:DNA mismatch endonuclease (patch repair protein)
VERALREKLTGGKFEGVPASHSRRMAAIRGQGNHTTEARFRAMLVRAGVRGWMIRTKGLAGKPDFFFPARQVAVFLDGCYWHGCPRCGHIPTVNRPFWKAKIERNQQRDRQNNGALQAIGVRVLRLWEHELREEGGGCLRRLKQLLEAPEEKREKRGRRRGKKG